MKTQHKSKIRIWLPLLILGLGFLAPANAAILSNEELTTVTDNSLIVTWTTTDESSTTEIRYGISSLNQILTVEGTSKWHYAQLTGLYPNTTYKYQIKSGNSLGTEQTIQTLERPSGDYLFSFAVMSDPLYAEGKSSTTGARGIPYSVCQHILTSEVADIAGHGVAFTVIDGNLVDIDPATTYGDQIVSKMMPKLESLTGASDLPAGTAYKYLVTPGYSDKKASYTTDWVTNGFKPITNPISLEARYGFNATSKDVDSVMNYSFSYKYYNFVFLDSVRRPATATGLINTDFVRSAISAEARKAFIFSSYPTYDLRGVMVNGSLEKDYPIDIPSSEGGVFCIDNDAALRSTLEALEDPNGNPLAAAVISAHIGDNYKRSINDITYLRQGPASQYPTGYSIYKVYSNGFIKSFYKTTGRNGDGKPYYEVARDLISDESGVTGQLFQSFWLGSNSMRNFSTTYPFVPGISPAVNRTAPTSNESTVPLNSPIIITFNKPMLASATNLTEWVTIAETGGSNVVISSASFDASHTILTVNHANLTINKTYTVTVNSSKVRDEGSGTMASDYTFAFNTTDSILDVTPPVGAVNNFPLNTVTDPLPSFVGTATDESGVAAVAWRIDGGSWLSAEAVDGAFGSTREVFSFVQSTLLNNGTHVLELKTTDIVGNISTTFYSYSFTVAEDKPAISVRIDGRQPLPGDTIAATPKIQMSIVILTEPATGEIIMDTTRISLASLSPVKVNTTYYVTYEPTTPLSNGPHGFTVEAYDGNGNQGAYQLNPLYVESANPVNVQGLALNYPNPFDPSTQTTKISYNLTKASTITISILDLSGNLIYKENFASGSTGGQAGYNEVTWTGRSALGDIVGNGLYIYLIISDGRVLSRGKLTVHK